MRAFAKWLVPALLASLPIMSLPCLAFARSDEAKYCSALVDRLQQANLPESARTRAAAQACKSRDPAAAISTLEAALQGANLNLPPRRLTLIGNP